MYVIMQGWKTGAERVCFEIENRKDATKLYLEMFAEWFERYKVSDYAERYLNPEIASFVAQEERPYLLVRSEQGLKVYLSSY